MALASGIVWFTIHQASPTVGTRFSNCSIQASPTAGSISEFSVPSADSYPTGIAAGPDGNLWFTETSGNKIGRISPSGTITEFPVPTAKSGPAGSRAGPDGNLWFTDL